MTEMEFPTGKWDDSEVPVTREHTRDPSLKGAGLKEQLLYNIQSNSEFQVPRKQKAD